MANSRTFLKGIARLRRQITQPSYKEVDGSNYRDPYGDRLPRGIVVRVPVSSGINLPELGSGGYSTVYALDDDRVLKVSRGRDIGYDNFAVLAMCNQHNPHFPKIYYRGKWGNNFVYVLERLNDQYSNNENRNALNEAVRASHRMGKYVTITDPHVKEAVDLLHKHNLANDVGGNNTLSRDDGTPVFSDPCAAGRDDNAVDPLTTWTPPEPEPETGQTLGDILAAALKKRR